MSTLIEDKLKEEGILLPGAPVTAGNYLPFVQTGNLVYISGMLALRNGEITCGGPVGSAQTLETGYEAARTCTLNALATLKAAAGSLDRVKRIVFVNGYVYAVDGFTDSPLVINGASDLLVQVFGEPGRHARAAVAVNGLPKGSSVEIQMVAEVS